MPTNSKVAGKAPKGGPKLEKKNQNLGSSKSGLMKNSQLMSRSIAESRGRLHAPSRRWRDGELREGDEDMDEAWLTPKQVLKPDDQLQLDEKEMKEEITRILTADNPHAPHNIIQYNFKDHSFKHVPHVEQFAMHYTLDGNLLHQESDEAQRQLAKDEDEEEEEEEDEENQEEQAEEEGEGGETKEDEGSQEKSAGKKGGKKLKNQFNYSERASQTYNYPLRERSTMTEPPPRANFSSTANQMEIFDTYVEELEKQKKEKEKKGTKLSSSKDDDKLVGKKIMGDLQGNDDITRVSGALKIMERMVNQNTYEDIAQDFKFYDDPSDEFQDGKGTLLPLWKFSYEETKRVAVTSLCWSPKHLDLILVAHGMYDFGDKGKGYICFQSLKNPTFPEQVFKVASGIMSLDIHPTVDTLIAAGLYDGSVCVFDLSSKQDKPRYQSTTKTGKHADPVWQVSWQTTAEGEEPGFYSVSSDGQVISWTIVKNELRCQTMARLTLTSLSTAGEDSVSAVSSAGTCFDFNKTSQHLFIVGSEEGNVYKCSKAFTGHFTDVVAAHHLAIYSLKWNPFHSSIYASCGADWSVKIWDNNMSTPMFVYDLNSVVSDIAWAPYASTVFAACTAEGKVHIFDLSINKYEALCVQSVILKKKTKLTRLAFNPSFPILAVGDDRGTVTMVKLSPNLRKALKEKNYSRDNEVAKMEKLMSFVKEPLLEKKK